MAEGNGNNARPEGMAVAEMHLKIGSEYAVRARHHDVVRAMIDVGLVTFTSLSFVLFAALYDRPDPNIYVLFAIAFLVITLGVFGIVFSAGRELSIQRWQEASDFRFAAATEAAGVEGGPSVANSKRLTGITYVIYLLMAVTMVGPGAVLVYASWILLP